MTIKSIMNSTIVTVEMDDSLQVIKEIFDHTRFHHLLVVESKRLCGIISDRDLLKAVSPNIGTAAETQRDAVTLKKKAHQIMSRKVITLLPEATVFDAIAIFNQHNISCIPVVNKQQQPVGVVSWRDILKMIEANYRAQNRAAGHQNQ